MKSYEKTILKIDYMMKKRRKIVHVRFSNNEPDFDVRKSNIQGRPYCGDYLPEFQNELKFF